MEFKWFPENLRSRIEPFRARFVWHTLGISTGHHRYAVHPLTCSRCIWLFMLITFIYFFCTGCVDACILATLAFILATRHVRLQPEPMYQNSMFKGKASNEFKHFVEIWTNCHVAGEVNNAYLTDAVSMAGSRKSLNLQPVLLVAPPHHMNGQNGDDSVSQFSNRTPSRYNRPDFHNSMHHFQL